HADSRTPQPVNWWLLRTRRLAGSAHRQTPQILRCRSKTDEGSPTTSVGEDPGRVCDASTSHVETEAKTDQSTEGRIGGESGESTSGQGSKAGGSCESGTGGKQESRCQKSGHQKGGEEGCAGQESGGEGEEGDGNHRDRGADSLIVLLVGFRPGPAFEDSIETWLGPGASL